MVCEGGLSGLMAIQMTATFQTYGIEPGFNDFRGSSQTFVKTCTYCLLKNDVVDTVYSQNLPFLSSWRTMRIRVSGSTSATKSLSSSVSVVLSLSESSGVK